MFKLQPEEKCLNHCQCFHIHKLVVEVPLQFGIWTNGTKRNEKPTKRFYQCDLHLTNHKPTAYIVFITALFRWYKYVLCAERKKCCQGSCLQYITCSSANTEKIWEFFRFILLAFIFFCFCCCCVSSCSFISLLFATFFIGKRKKIVRHWLQENCILEFTSSGKKVSWNVVDQQFVAQVNGRANLHKSPPLSNLKLMVVWNSCDISHLFVDFQTLFVHSV